MKNKRFKKYEALGFVEALMAIMIVGISSVILMQIAVNTIQNTIQNEAIDNITQYAVEGAGLAQELADKEKSTGENLFPDKQNWGSCFSFTNSQEEVIEFKKEDGNVFTTFNEEDRNIYKDVAILDSDDLYFRIVCLDQSTADDVKFVVGKIKVGQRVSKGDITKGNLVKDYTYFTVINL